MVAKRPTMRRLSDEKHQERLAEMAAAVADGRLTIRQMTPAERVKSDARFAAGREAREARHDRSKRNRVARGV